MRRRALNPVLRRELVERWRGRRAFVVFTVYLAVLAGITQLLYWVGQKALSAPFGFGRLGGGPALGRFLFENLVGFILLLVLFIAPGYAAGQIAGERERRTLPLLQVTLLRPHQIVAGKLGASVSWLLLLVVAALPFGAASFFLGGVSTADLVAAVAYILLVAVAIAAMSLAASSLTRRTVTAVVLTYALVLVLVIGSGFAAIVETFVRNRDGPGPFQRPLSLYVNPFYGLADAARAAEPGSGMALPSMLSIFAVALPRPDVPVPAPMPVAVPEGAAVDEVAPLQRPIGEPRARIARGWVWPVEALIYAVLGLAGLAVATLRVRSGRVGARPKPPGRQQRPDRVGAAAGEPS